MTSNDKLKITLLKNILQDLELTQNIVESMILLCTSLKVSLLPFFILSKRFHARK